MLLAAVVCSSCHGTGCAPLPSAFILTAPVPVAFGPSQSWPEKSNKKENAVPSPNGSVASATTSPIGATADVAEAVRVVPSFASVPEICACSCSDPWPVAVNDHVNV